LGGLQFQASLSKKVSRIPYQPINWMWWFTFLHRKGRQKDNRPVLGKKWENQSEK
jgi:hypothetical protein